MAGTGSGAGTGTRAGAAITTGAASRSTATTGTGARAAARLAVPAALALLCAVTLLSAPGHATPATPPATVTAGGDRPATTGEDGKDPWADRTRGTVVSATLVADLDAERVAARVREAGFATDRVRHGVRAHRVVYRTVDAGGRPTTASQLVVVPRRDTSGPRALRTVSWLHGTTVYRGDVASVNDRATDRAVAFLFAGAGFAVSAPDYLGLGEGPGFHPYGHPEATVSAALDGLRAARASVRRDDGRELRRRVRVGGFSQGGPATMMLGRALEGGADRYFRAGALAPVGGPFHLSAFEAAAADDRVVRSSLYLAYFATAWQRMYGLYDSPGEVFRAPYDTVVEELFDGHHTTARIAAALPATSRELFTPEFLDRVRHPTGELRRRLTELDSTCDWRPDVPVHLFHARGDRDVVIDHAEHCAGQLAAHGADHRLTDLGDTDHNGSVRAALPGVLRAFGSPSGGSGAADGR